MTRTLRITACAAALLVSALSALGTDAPEPCDKNHYILRQKCIAGWEWRVVGDLNAARMFHTATLLPGGKVLVVGGTDSLDHSAELYDPATRTWSLTEPLHVPRRYHTATLLSDGRVLVVGGDSEGYSEAGLGYAGTAEIYDPTTGTWALAGSLIVPRAAFTATLLGNGEVLVAGGVSNLDETLASAELFDPATRTWRVTGNLGRGRFSHSATALPSGEVLAVAGSDDDFFGTQLASTELYDPVSGTWRSAGYLESANVMHSATLLDDGRVLVAGGSSLGSVTGPRGITYFTSTTLGGSETYDPATGQWSFERALNAPRYGHSATLLANGQVLVSAGTVTTGQVPRLGNSLVTKSEVFDPASSSFTDAGALNIARDRPTATRLLDGSVLLVGGFVYEGYRAIPLKGAELFGPGLP